MRNRRSAAIFLWIAAVVLISLLAYGQFENLETSLRIRFADEQTAMFEQMRQQAERSGPGEAANCLSYVLNYYPSGTKQVAGSPLDRVVERARRCAVRQMISLLRTKTGQDFGDDPQRWMEGLKESTDQ